MSTLCYGYIWTPMHLWTDTISLGASQIRVGVVLCPGGGGGLNPHPGGGGNIAGQPSCGLRITHGT